MVSMDLNKSEISEQTDRKVVLVTGASSGIGEAVATRLVREGHHVVADSVSAFVEQALDHAGRVDVFVNNAGAMPLSRLDSLLVDEWDRMIDVNIRGLLHGIAAALPQFTAQGAGHFVTIASIGAHEVVPTSAVYSGSKYAAWAITEGLRQESDPAIRVTTISPGVVTSELADSITERGAAEMMRTYREHALEPDTIAKAVSYAIGQAADVDVNEIVVRPARQR
jgi:NADP-dependent 3-hydroxy acid dehydrogenase YdfG